MDITKSGNGERGIGNRKWEREWQTLFDFKMEDKSYIFISVFLIHNTFAKKRFKVTLKLKKKHPTLRVMKNS